MPQNNDYEISALRESDVSQMAEIEKMCFSVPWSEQSIRDELHTPFSRYFILRKNGRVLGYIGTRMLADECDITNIAVLPQERRHGIATRLFEELLSFARACGVRELLIEVREGNAPARAFYEKNLFREVGRRRMYYTLPEEDAILMTRTLED